jgi:hypothetical protein
LQQALESCQQERNAAWTRLLELQVEHEAQAAEWSERMADAEARVDRERADHAEHSAQWQQTVFDREAELQAADLRLTERDQRIESLSQEIDEAVRQHQQGERESREAASQIGSLHATIAALQTTIAALQTQIDTAWEAARLAELRLSELHRSSSWRITAPFRILKRRWPRIRSLGGSWLKALYLALPLPWSVKLRIKGLLFALFSPLLGHTHAYQAWLAFESARRRSPPGNP